MSIDSKDVLEKLGSEPSPMTWAKLKKAFVSKKTGVTADDLLRALSCEGVYRWPKDTYWHIDPVAQLNSAVVSQCANKALKKSELKVKGRSAKDVGVAIEHLLKERKLLKYPALAGATSLLVAAGTPEAYWEYVRHFVAGKLKKAGIEDVGFDEKIWNVLPQLEPELNIPVSTARLRRALGDCDKTRFDQAALKLRDERRVYLSQHDHPMALNENDRNLLIDGKDGRFYVAISRLG